MYQNGQIMRIEARDIPPGDFIVDGTTLPFPVVITVGAPLRDTVNGLPYWAELGSEVTWEDIAATSAGDLYAEALTYNGL